MNNCIRVALINLICVLSSGTAAAQSTEGSVADAQLWNEVQGLIRINPRVSFYFFGTIRFGDRLSEFADEHAGVGVNITFGKHFMFQPVYRRITANPLSSRAVGEHRFPIDFTAEVPLKAGWRLLDRNRTELRIVEGDFSVRYRNRLQVERTLLLGKHPLTPYFAGEIFYNSRTRAWNRSRLNLGARLPISKHLGVDLYYMYQYDDRSPPNNLHTAAIRFNVDF
ncbi:MAG: DUF2490 domain-containing protein [Acidobacteria bacterium]|nr:DUF2490 domain-containing protein [Acidobacteriota bacterium]MCW5970630.1 DUF2490 domain-containing protein [Blastocatellales bacterium]